MASLAEFRYGSAAHPGGHLSYENQYASSFLGCDASHMLPSISTNTNQLDFLYYADQLLNTFATAKNSNGEVVLTGKARDLMDFLPNDMEGLPSIPSFPHASDFLSSGQSAYGCALQQQAPASGDMWGAALAPTQHKTSQLAYQGYRTQQPPTTMVAVKQQEWRLCVKAPTLGTFYLFTDPEKTVADMIPDIESKILELYHVFVSVHLLQNDHGIDLPFSCAISSVLEDRALICVQYMRADEAAAVSLSGYTPQHAYHLQPTTDEAGARSSPHSSPHLSSRAHTPSSLASPCSPSSPQSPYLQSYSSGSMPSTPASQGEGQADTGVRFREPPPAKVLQNKEFSFTVAVKNLKNVFMAFNNNHPLGHHPLGNNIAQNDEHAGAHYAPSVGFSTHNPWGAPVPMPLDDGDDDGSSSFSNFEIPIDVVVEEEGGCVLHPRDYKIRCSVLDKQEGLYVFFVKLKKNSHYGRTRFVIKIRRKQPTKQDRQMEYLETSLLHNGNNRDGQLRLGNDQGGRGGDLLVSHPIVVISKERKTKRKREKASAQ